ncbi:ABC transporter permease [uncultured Alsobacter sp.]|uniref:ABC transporter permease n=1 Tax=uncultured Alsobacter sp. TaxID=1748258 RepID=UPI0025D4A952|nr:ABC transporter permease [uncultured Alsobacter sp.]
MTTRDRHGLAAVPFGLAGLAVLLAAWWSVTALALVPRTFLPAPALAWAALVRGWTVGDLAGQTAQTVLRMLGGWLLASLAGVALGSLVGLSATARRYLGPSLAFMRALPASAVIPVAIAFAGLSPGMVLGVVAFGSLWPTLLSTVHGFATIDPRLRDVASALHMSNAAFVWKIGLPNALADILTGMRLSMTVALILSVTGEMLAAQQGLGQAILLAARSFRSADLFAGLILLGVIGIASTLVLAAVERRCLRWR